MSDFDWASAYLRNGEFSIPEHVIDQIKEAYIKDQLRARGHTQTVEEHFEADLFEV